MKSIHQDIADLLYRRELLSQHEVESALRDHGDARLDHFLIETGMVSEDQILAVYHDEFGIPTRSLETCSIDPELLEQFPSAELLKHEVLPIERAGDRVYVATHDPFGLEAFDTLAARTGLRLAPVLTRRIELLRVMKDVYGLAGGALEELLAVGGDDYATETLECLNVEESVAHASVVKLVNELFADAVRQGASDIHFEPNPSGVSLRFRVDGMLRVEPAPSSISQFASAIVSRIKIMAKLNIAEKRLPQDGRISLRAAGRDLDVRVSTVPMVHGESIVMRLLDKGRKAFDMNALALPDTIEPQFRRLIQRPHGIVFVTGPTGSGKTTTLYSALAEIRNETKKIVTVEDPVEYQLYGVHQIQVQPKIGLTFAAGLRSILRHDPDVILVGEVRDEETSHIAIQCSLTGHLVFSTVHTNDAASAFPRLIEMGVEPYLVSSTVSGVLAQRLVRRLCHHCKREMISDQLDIPADFPGDIVKASAPVGCIECRDTGYVGRIGIFELLVANEEVRSLVQSRAGANEISALAKNQGMASLRESGWDRVREGVTSVEEVLRVTAGDE